MPLLRCHARRHTEWSIFTAIRADISARELQLPCPTHWRDSFHLWHTPLSSDSSYPNSELKFIPWSLHLSNLSYQLPNQLVDSGSPPLPTPSHFISPCVCPGPSSPPLPLSFKSIITNHAHSPQICTYLSLSFTQFWLFSGYFP